MGSDYLGGRTLANHKSAVKRTRQDVKRSQHNSAIKASIRTAEKKLRAALLEKKNDIIDPLFKDYTSQMSRAGRKGIYHAKTASRKIGRLAKAISSGGHSS